VLLKQDPKVKFSIANSVWCNDLQADYVSVIQKTFSAEARAIASKDVINKWVSEKTSGKIPTILESEPEELGAVLINAIYFKGDWQKPFEQHEVESGRFNNAEGKATDVKMMTKRGMRLRYHEDEFVQVAEFPYGNDGFTATFVLPRANDKVTFEDPAVKKPAGKRTPTSLDAIVEKCSAATFNAWIVKLVPHKGVFSIPKFKLEDLVKMNDILKKLGMVRAYDEKTAEFGPMSPIPKWVQTVVHKTFVDVNETGTEAAAVTAMMMGGGGAPKPEPFFTMNCNHPFLFAIRHRASNTLVFIGKISNI